MSEHDRKYERWLETATREELVEKIRNQRGEIKNLARAYNRAISHAGEYHTKIRHAVKRLKNGQHLTALWHLTGKCDNSEGIMRELAQKKNRLNIEINMEAQDAD